MSLQKVVAIQDDSSHWYIIPAEMRKEFRRLEELASNDDDAALDEFIDKFNKYRTGGDVNNVQLYAEIK
jgi:hypothetical protein